MKRPKPVCETVMPWLRENLGKACLAPLTGTDARALCAAVQIIELYAYTSDAGVVVAFGKVVNCMQLQCQQFAYHAIAHVMNWEDRPRIWREAGLTDFGRPWVCSFEPGGKERS